MLESKSKIVKKLQVIFDSIIYSRDLKPKYLEYLRDKKDIPAGLAMDYMTNRLELSDASEFILYSFCEGVNNLGVCGFEDCTKYFTEDEKKYYSVERFKKKTLEFPLRFSCIQVSNNQWIGVSSVQRLMELREAQILVYNENAQRVLEKKVKNNSEFWTISLNKKSVGEIRELLSTDQFIPNTLTFNIPEDSDAEFEYRNNELIFKKLDRLDISDGYHRYIGMCNEYDLNNAFDYPIEIRFFNFSDEKVRQFIFQDYQRTPMKKVDAESLNTNKTSNIIVERLNNDKTNFLMQGEIKRVDGKINFGQLSAIIDYFYCKGKKLSNKDIIAIEKEVCEIFNNVIQSDESAIDRNYSYADLYFIFCSAKNKDKTVGIIEIDDFKRYRKEQIQRLRAYADYFPRTRQTNIINEYYESKQE